MTKVFDDRTISMILTIPNVKELSHSDKNLDRNPKPPSIPIYRGSIIRIEQHRDDLNTSDLIVRVPNFHHVSTPSVTISINDDRSDETDSQREARIKRRAPICPIINGTYNSNKSENIDLDHSGITNAKRLAIGLRNLRRTILANCKVKRSTNINRITIIPVLPDVEVIREDFQAPISEKKNSSASSKFFLPKILFLKRKKYTINKKRQASVDSQTDTENNRTNQSSRANFHLTDNENESNKIYQEDKSNNIPSVNTDNEESSRTIAQLIPNIPISLTNPETSAKDLQPDITSVDQNEEPDDVEEGLYIVHPNDDTCSEFYEVTYEFDPEFQHFINPNKEQIYLPEVQDQPSIKFNFNPFEYQDLTSAITPWVSITPSNDYEQIDQTQSNPSLDHFERKPPHPHVKFQFLEDLSQTDPDPTSTLSSTQDPIICLNESSMINEDYAVILQFLKHALEIESIPEEDCDEFNKQVKELFQSTKLNELE